MTLRVFSMPAGLFFLFYQKYAKTCAEKVYDVPFKIVGAVTLIVVEPAVQYLQLKQYIRRQKE